MKKLIEERRRWTEEEGMKSEGKMKQDESRMEGWRKERGDALRKEEGGVKARME